MLAMANAAVLSRVESRWSYNGYRKSVFAISFLESLRLAATCDGSVHVSPSQRTGDERYGSTGRSWIRFVVKLSAATRNLKRRLHLQQ